MQKGHYIKTTCRIRDRLEIEKHYDIRYGAPGMPREKKKKKTPEEIARQNLWLKERYLRRLIELNYTAGDWHVTLTCRKDMRPTMEEAPLIIRKFWTKLREAYKRRGWELKVIITCETGKRGATHWHVIVNDMHNGQDSTASLIRSLWDRGRAYFSPLDDTGDYKVLAEYMVKETSARIKQEETTEKLSYMCSRNLLRPVVKQEKVYARGWKKEPKVPKGWELVKGTLLNGINKYTGLPYQHYTIQRKEESYESRGYLHRDKHKRTGERYGSGNVPDEMSEE